MRPTRTASRSSTCSRSRSCRACTKDELDTRIGQAFTSKTYADLAAVTADLPPRPAAAPRPAQNVKVEAAASLTIFAIAVPVALLQAGYLTGNAGLVKLAVLVVILDLLGLLAAGGDIKGLQNARTASGIILHLQ